MPVYLGRKNILRLQNKLSRKAGMTSLLACLPASNLLTSKFLSHANSLWISDIKNQTRACPLSVRYIQSVSPQTTLSCVICSLRNNKICPSRGNRKNLIYFLYLTWGGDTLVVSFQILLMKGSYTITFIAYIKSHPNWWGLRNCPSQGNENYLKWLQLLVPLVQYSHLKITFGIKCSSNLF